MSITVKVETAQGTHAETMVRVFSFFPIFGPEEPVLDADSEGWVIPYSDVARPLSSNIPRPAKRVYEAMACPMHKHGSIHNAAAKMLSRFHELREMDPSHPILIHPCAGGFPGCPEFAEMVDIVRINPYKDPPSIGRWDEEHWHSVQWRTNLAKLACEPRPLYVTIQNIPDSWSGGRISPPTSEQIRLLVYYAISRGARGLFYRVSSDMPDRTREQIGALNAEIRFLSPLLRIGEPLPVGSCSEPLVEANTLLCGDKDIVLILINHDHEFGPDWPKQGEYFSCVPVMNSFAAEVIVPPGIRARNVFEVGGNWERPEFSQNGQVVKFTVGGIRNTRQFVITSDDGVSERNVDSAEGSFRRLREKYRDTTRESLVRRADGNVPDIQFQEKQHNFGFLDSRDKITHSFGFKNAGSNELVIKSVECQSEGILVTARDTELLPGETGILEVALDGTRCGVGRLVETIHVRTNDPDEPEVRLQVGGVVSPGVVCTPSKVRFGTIRKGTMATKKIRVLNRRKDSQLAISELGSPADFFSVEKVKLSKDEYEVLITLASSAPLGVLDSTARILTNDRNWPVLEVPISGEVIGPIAVRPESVFFGSVKEGTAATCSVAITSSDDIRLKIRRVESDLTHVTTQIVRGVGGLAYRIVATLQDTASPGLVKGNLTVYTDNEEQPVLQVPVHGLVKG